MIEIGKVHELRHRLHKNPEGGFREYETKKILLKFLSDLPKNYFKIYEVLETGLVVEYRNAENKSFVLFRADMDALPIEEETNVDFASENPGWMHACGHDIHMSVLTGLIKQVARELPEANILFFFQPAEEGPGGAKPFLESGFLDSYDVKAAFALHVSPDYKMGTVASKEGVIFASPTEFDVIFKGESAHGAKPDEGRDTILPASEFITAFYSALTRFIPEEERYVFTIGKLVAGDRRNIVAEKSIIEGTYRVLDIKTKEKIDELMERFTENISKTWKVQGEVRYGAYYPVLMNDSRLFKALAKTVKSIGLEFAECETKFTGEDFAFFSQRYPSLMFWLGCATETMKAGLHTSKFLPEDRCIDFGVKVFYSLLKEVSKED
ncbi:MULTISPECIES: M20 family metallopeptidase [unclassified Kosmotoga]|jgi:N-acetyldiaminopimelate deacetylase|uniref:M20 metallopeptidase family protein n=1 Tax=unclassified Kosmotoga TaxID=2631489 RepID=UPI0007C57969|nr:MULTISPECIES: M20 family metallopeptidase [unclassified Kosmotoga]MDI3524407.1 N-acetyldiaminopimelate deacetylase [Kosmotoga sp.]MDK2954123.1 N-acetyldiaminopimelate deacetylase [Kosmotoga sp.]OAA23291.1 hypothetical protein DU53_02810 [Kosmotoga sp. DU53]